MKRLLLLALLICGLTGCPFVNLADLDIRDARLTNNIAAMTLEASITTAELLYELEQRIVMEAALKEEGMTKTILRDRIEAVRAMWAPVWQVVDEVRGAQAKLAAAMEAEETLAATAAAIEYAAKQANFGVAISSARERVLKEKR